MTIALIGATGYTGSLCAKELVRRGLGAIWIARSRERLDALATELGDVPRRVASPDHPDALAAALAGATVVLNTVGPFQDLGEPVVRAAIAAKVPYVDTTGEQVFMATMFARCDEAARAANVAVICAGAFEYSLGDCAAAIAVDDLDGADEVDVYYVTRNAKVSHGTAKSALRAAGGPAFAWESGARVPHHLVATEVSVPGQARPFAVISIPGGEALHVPRRRAVGAVRTWVGLPPNATKWAARLRFALPALRVGVVRALADKAIDKRLSEPSAAERAQARFTIAARARTGDRERWCVIEGTDPYGLTAVLAVEHAARLADGRSAAVGVVSTAMAFDPLDFLGSVGLTATRS